MEALRAYLNTDTAHLSLIYAKRFPNLVEDTLKSSRLTSLKIHQP